MKNLQIDIFRHRPLRIPDVIRIVYAIHDVNNAYKHDVYSHKSKRNVSGLKNKHVE